MSKPYKVWVVSFDPIVEGRDVGGCDWFMNRDRAIGYLNAQLYHHIDATGLLYRFLEWPTSIDPTMYPDDLTNEISGWLWETAPGRL